VNKRKKNGKIFRILFRVGDDFSASSKNENSAKDFPSRVDDDLEAGPPGPGTKLKES
jgi:hypothetical protein